MIEHIDEIRKAQREAVKEAIASIRALADRFAHADEFLQAPVYFPESFYDAEETIGEFWKVIREYRTPEGEVKNG